MTIYHGVCITCANQNKGVFFCRNCQYFNKDWDLPDLYSEHPGILYPKKEKKMYTCNLSETCNKDCVYKNIDRTFNFICFRYKIGRINVFSVPIDSLSDDTIYRVVNQPNLGEFISFHQKEYKWTSFRSSCKDFQSDILRWIDDEYMQSFIGVGSTFKSIRGYSDEFIPHLIKYGFVQKEEEKWKRIYLRDIGFLLPGVKIKREYCGCTDYITIQQAPHLSYRESLGYHILVYGDKTGRNKSVNDLFSGEVYIKE